MFENTLLIIKPDYMHNRKALLQCLLSKGFQIQGSRRLAFTPEDAAEFNRDTADNKCYMLYVILLSKGISEAFILTKENAVEDLIKEMVCFFGTSNEMERNVHVSKTIEAARREITFIFPNYIHEPIEPFDRHIFCKQPIMKPFMSEIYNIMKEEKADENDNWRTKLSEWLITTNPSLPALSNQCSLLRTIGSQNRGQQTDPVPGLSPIGTTATEHIVASSTSGASSGLITSSSCISCSSFERDDTCKVMQQQLSVFEEKLKFRGQKTLKESAKEEQTERVCDEHIEVVNVYEYEDGEMYDVTDDDFERRIEAQGEGMVEWQGGGVQDPDVDADVGGVVRWDSAAEIKVEKVEEKEGSGTVELAPEAEGEGGEATEAVEEAGAEEVAVEQTESVKEETSAVAEEAEAAPPAEGEVEKPAEEAPPVEEAPPPAEPAPEPAAAEEPPEEVKEEPTEGA